MDENFFIKLIYFEFGREIVKFLKKQYVKLNKI